MVALDDVPWWWVEDGLGHVLLSECACGRCPDRYAAMCGASGKGGLKTHVVPGRICPECRELLGSPCIVASP